MATFAVKEQEFAVTASGEKSDLVSYQLQEKKDVKK